MEISDTLRSIPGILPGISDAPPSCTHFVGFRDDRLWCAVRVFGRPDFIHRKWDRRARREIADGDTIVFATGEHDQAPSPFNGNDLVEVGCG